LSFLTHLKEGIMKSKKLAIATAFATIAIALAPTAAHATPFSGGHVVIGNNTDGADWQIYADGGIDHSYVYVAGQTFDRVICGTSGGLLVDENSFNVDGAGLDQTTDSNGDIVTVGNGTFSNGLDAAVEYRLYAEGDLLRTSYVLTNNTGTPITFTPSVDEDPSDNSSDSATTTSGDNIVDLNDTWYSTFDVTSPSAVYTKFWGATPVNVRSLSVAASESSDLVDFANVTIAAGASYNWIFFHSYKGYDVSGDDAAKIAAAQAAGAAAVAEFSASGDALPTSGRILRGLDLSIESNWKPAQESSTSSTKKKTLANTGSNDNALLEIAAALVVLGSTVLVARRRSRRA
jgi:LPXTG-motif cell wall-anchored protein